MTRGVGYFALLVAFPRKDGAGIAETHRDDDVGGLDDLVSPGLGEFAGDSDADLESAAVTTGLKWALETGPNIKMSTANPKTVAVEFSKSCKPTSSGDSCAAAIPEPTTTVTSKAVPTNSARSLRGKPALCTIDFPPCSARRATLKVVAMLRGQRGNTPMSLGAH